MNTKQQTIEQKLFQVQARVGKIAKDSTNPFYNSRYFDINKLIEHIQPMLFEYEMLLTQPLKDGMVYSIITDTATGSSVESSLQIPPIEDPQAIGKTITYYRRYTLASLLALQAEDDDGNSGSQAVQSGKTWSNNDNRKWLNEGTKEWANAENKISSGQITMQDLKKHYKLNKQAQNYFMSLTAEVS